jgi:hypothetical protein
MSALLLRARAAQLRPQSWGSMWQGVAVADRDDGGYVYVREMLQHQQRLTDLIAELVAAVEARDAAITTAATALRHMEGWQEPVARAMVALDGVEVTR